MAYTLILAQVLASILIVAFAPALALALAFVLVPVQALEPLKALRSETGLQRVEFAPL